MNNSLKRCSWLAGGWSDRNEPAIGRDLAEDQIEEKIGEKLDADSTGSEWWECINGVVSEEHWGIENMECTCILNPL